MILYRKKFIAFVLAVAVAVLLIGVFVAAGMAGVPRVMSCVRLGALCDSFGFYAYLSGVGMW